MGEIVISLIGSYMIGSISFAFFIGKLFKGIDIRQYGSGNLGATNVARVLGLKYGIGIFFLDACKGALAVYLGQSVAGPVYLPILCGLAAVLGHCTPFYLRFKGGKGVATGAGVLFMLMPWVCAMIVVVWVVVLLFSGRVSLASVMAAGVLPVLILLYGQPFYLLIFGMAGAIFVIYKHKGNIKRLLEGTEPKADPWGFICRIFKGGSTQ